MGQLEERAVAAYTGAGSQMDVLLGASDLSEFSDRLEFMGALAQNDADLATAALNARQQAEWAAERYAKTIEEKQAELEQMVGQARRDPADARRAEGPGRPAEPGVPGVHRAAGGPGCGCRCRRGSCGRRHRHRRQHGHDRGRRRIRASARLERAAVAIAAAQSVLGAPYVWGSAGPDAVRLLGLTSWAYAQAGVYLPHSSAAQASSFPEVSYSSAQPGDLLFFYSPISHVSLYLGGGMMIHARHPGPGGEVQFGSVSGYGTPVVKVTRPT